jgi:hypothetical protein
MSKALRGLAVDNELLSDILTACIYVSSALAMMAIVFSLPLQGLLATSGIVAIVLGLALQSTLSDVFSGISLSIEKSYRLGDEILLEGGVEGEVIAMNWRSTHLKNGANDAVIVPNSAIAKMRIQNHSAGSKRYNGGLTIVVDSRNDPQLTLDILKHSAMTCPAILEHPEPSAAATEFKGDRITYDVSFSTSSFVSAAEARSQLIGQLYKRARPVVGGQRPTIDEAVIFFPENELCDHLPLLEPLNDAERQENLGSRLNKQQSVRVLYNFYRLAVVGQLEFIVGRSTHGYRRDSFELLLHRFCIASKTAPPLGLPGSLLSGRTRWAWIRQ